MYSECTYSYQGLHPAEGRVTQGIHDTELCCSDSDYRNPIHWLRSALGGNDEDAVDTNELTVIVHGSLA